MDLENPVPGKDFSKIYSEKLFTPRQLAGKIFIKHDDFICMPVAKEVHIFDLRKFEFVFKDTFLENSVVEFTEDEDLFLIPEGKELLVFENPAHRKEQNFFQKLLENKTYRNIKIITKS